MTTIDTRFGRLEFENGYPTETTTKRLFDEMDFQRAAQLYLWAVPAVSFESFRQGMKRDLGVDYNDFAIWENPKRGKRWAPGAKLPGLQADS
jgi:hypothetical protein